MGALRIRTALAGLAAGVRIKLADIIASNGSTARAVARQSGRSHAAPAPEPCRAGLPAEAA